MMITESIKVERVAIAIKNLAPQLSGTTIVQLSDLHYDGIRLSETTLQQAIALSNQANPDLVVITGDFVTDNPSPIEQLAAHLKNLNSPKIRKYIPRPLRDRLPYLKNCAKIVKHINWYEGWHQVGTNQLYVNRGLGSYFPGRFYCPPEVTVITLECR
jgi:predicted MPP superfamily phosphohydrolase